MSSDKLPDGWTRVKFGDVVRKVNDRVDPDTAGIERYVAGEHMDTDDLTIRRWGEVGDGYLGPAFHMRFKPGHVLYGSRRTYLRKVAVADFEGVTANTTFVLESSSRDLLPEFLPLVMTTEAFHDHSIKQSKGSVNPYINFSDLTWYEFALPPIDEQRQTVTLLTQASRLSRSISIVEPEIVARSHTAQMWAAARTYVKLGSVVDQIVSRLSDHHGSEVPTVLLEDMDKSSQVQVGFGSPNRVSGPLTEFREYDILYGKLRPNLRKIAISTFDGACGSEVIVLRCKQPDHALSLLSILRSEAFYQTASRFFKGTKMPRINPVDLLRCEIPEPSSEWRELARVTSESLQLSDRLRSHAGRTRQMNRVLRENLLGRVQLV